MLYKTTCICIPLFIPLFPIHSLAHATDNLRLDIVIPAEKHIYVKAASTQERQQWLVALGTAKSQGADSRIRKSSDIYNDFDRTSTSV